MIKIYGVRRSRATRPIWVLNETGQDHELVRVTFAARLADPLAADAPLNTASPAYLAINEVGQIPAMVDGDLLLTESLAIAIYLAEKAGGELAPQSLREKGELAQWALLAATGIETPALAISSLAAQGKADTDEGRAVVADSLAKLARPMRRVEAHLSAHQWLMGDRFTVADIVLAECLRYATGVPGTLSAWPATAAWLARCHARPAFQKMWADREAEVLETL